MNVENPPTAGWIGNLGLEENTGWNLENPVMWVETGTGGIVDAWTGFGKPVSPGLDWELHRVADTGADWGGFWKCHLQLGRFDTGGGTNCRCWVGF